MTGNRLQLAEELLREAVYRSRERQAALQALRPGAAPGGGSCGLGDKAEVVLDLSDRGREICLGLFGARIADVERLRIRDATAAWIERQDAFDRKRNHFLKDFRGRHGFDRGSYAPDVAESFEAGLVRIAAEEDAARRQAAERLLSPRA